MVSTMHVTAGDADDAQVGVEVGIADSGEATKNSEPVRPISFGLAGAVLSEQLDPWQTVKPSP